MNEPLPDPNASSSELSAYLERQVARMAELEANLKETLKRIEMVSANLARKTAEMDARS